MYKKIEIPNSIHTFVWNHSLCTSISFLDM